MNELDKLYDEYEGDKRLAHMRTPGIRLVEGRGPMNPDLMIIGEAPGPLENANGLPFIGIAGTMLTQILKDVGIEIYDAFVTNAVKYWPWEYKEGNGGKKYQAIRQPTAAEIEVSREYLLREIDIVNPTIVGLCGRIPALTVVPEYSKVSTFNGSLVKDRFVPLYHPSVAARDPSVKGKVKEGYAKLAGYIEAHKERVALP